ncbi:T9SS type A sorting domain-containing protein, partial [Bacteroidota bacterium]
YRFIYLISLLIFCVSISAYGNDSFDSQSKDNLSALKINNDINKNVLFEKLGSCKSNSIQEIAFRSIRFHQFGARWNLYSNTHPFAYDPISGLYLIANIDNINIPEGSGSKLFKYQGQVYYSANNGNNWDTLTLFDEENFGLLYPSITVNNHNNAQNINDIPLTLGGLWADGTDNVNPWSFKGYLTSFKNDGTTEFLVDVNTEPETNNNSNQYRWASMNLVSSGTSKMSYGASRLSIDQRDMVQYGAYGFLSIENDIDDYGYPQSILPAEWDIDQFMSSQDINSTPNSNIEIRMDNNENIFVSVLNVPNGQTTYDRVPMVSKSSDQGETWSDFNVMPKSLLDDYKSNTTYANVWVYAPFVKYSFLVLDDDKYCLYFTLGLGADNTQTPDEIHLVEARYSGGIWTLTNIHDFQGSLPTTFQSSDKYHDQNIWNILMVASSSLGYEIQAALTQDYQDIVVKFLDMSFIHDFDEPMTYTYEDNNGDEQDSQTPLSGIQVFDIFVANSGINGGNWNINQMTNDSINYLGTWMPDIIPDKNHIPFLYAYVRGTYYPDPPHSQYNSLPSTVKDRNIDIGYSSTMGLATPLSVEENPENYNFNVFEVYPNPVTGLAEFTFELDVAQNVRIELCNSIGQLVEVIYEDYTGSGLHGINVDLSKYSNGVYYYSLITDNNRATKLMNIVK